MDDTVIVNDALSGSEEKTETNDATAETNDAMSVTSEDKTLTSGGGLLETHGNNMASVSTLSSNSIPQGSTITPTVRTKEKE